MKKVDVRSNINFMDVLLLVFIVLKLVGVINWSWWWVLAPLWIPIGLLVLFFIVAAIFRFLEEWL